jgi:hypothetical protein
MGLEQRGANARKGERLPAAQAHWRTIRPEGFSACHASPSVSDSGIRFVSQNSYHARISLNNGDLLNLNSRIFEAQGFNIRPAAVNACARLPRRRLFPQ